VKEWNTVRVRNEPWSWWREVNGSIPHAKVFGKFPVALVQSTGNNCLSLLWKTKGVLLTHQDQLRVRRARAFNFGAFGPDGVNANSLLIGVHVRKDFDIIWVKHVAGGH
jgi:hypothetical protein